MAYAIKGRGITGKVIKLSRMGGSRKGKLSFAGRRKILSTTKESEGKGRSAEKGRRDVTWQKGEKRGSMCYKATCTNERTQGVLSAPKNVL